MFFRRAPPADCNSGTNCRACATRLAGRPLAGARYYDGPFSPASLKERISHRPRGRLVERAADHGRTRIVLRCSGRHAARIVMAHVESWVTGAWFNEREGRGRNGTVP